MSCYKILSHSLSTKHVLCSYTREDFPPTHAHKWKNERDIFQNFSSCQRGSTVSLSVDTLLNRLARLNSKYSLGHFITFSLALHKK